MSPNSRRSLKPPPDRIILMLVPEKYDKEKSDERWHMAKIALLVPNEDMLDTARSVVKRRHFDVDYMKVIRSVDTVKEARAAVEAGAHIIVARGYQAKLIKEYTNIPLVEIRLHAQEIGLLLKKAKTMIKKANPTIGLVAFRNMLCDMSRMEELFDVRLQIEWIDKMEDITQKLDGLSKEKPDLIIGGEVCCREAEKMGYPALFYDSTEESIEDALQSAKQMAFAVEVEKQNAAQFETMLDTNFNGIIKVNREGKIIVVNRLIENLIGRNSEDVIGHPVAEIFPEFDMKAVNTILTGKRDEYAISVLIRNQVWMLMIAPIQYDDQITGAILSMHREDNEQMRRAESRRRDMFLHGFSANASFQSIRTENEQMKEVLEQAQEYALSDSPVLLYAEEGTEYYLIAEAIHNNSARKAGPFVSIDLTGMDKAQQMETLFGGDPDTDDSGSKRKGALINANHGTIFLKGAEYLTLRTQQQICRTLFSHSYTKTDIQPMNNLDVRLMISAKMNLRYLVENGNFSDELYYLLQGLTIDVPNLNQRPEDLMYYLDKLVKRYAGRYSRRLVMTDGAVEKIKMLQWKGNLIQLNAFCERLVITSQKRVVDEARIQNLYSELYPHIRETKGEDKLVIYKSPEAVELGDVLEKHHGNRELAARELGISTTTLWRRMKKYGIEANYR